MSVGGLDEKVNRLVEAKAFQNSDAFIRIHAWLVRFVQLMLLLGRW